MALCNQPEAFASDLGDDQSRYLWLHVLDNWLYLFYKQSSATY